MKETQMKRITEYVVFKIDREGVRGGITPPAPI
jgi:hypothetical protein